MDDRGMGGESRKCTSSQSSTVIINCKTHYSYFFIKIIFCLVKTNWTDDLVKVASMGIFKCDKTTTWRTYYYTDVQLTKYF